jgi:hypothetical protein
MDGVLLLFQRFALFRKGTSLETNSISSRPTFSLKASLLSAQFFSQSLLLLLPTRVQQQALIIHRLNGARDVEGLPGPSDGHPSYDFKAPGSRAFLFVASRGGKHTFLQALAFHPPLRKTREGFQASFQCTENNSCFESTLPDAEAHHINYVISPERSAKKRVLDPENPWDGEEVASCSP